MIQKSFIFLTVLFSTLYSVAQTSTDSNYISDFSKSSHHMECAGITMGNYTGKIKRSTVYYGEKITFYYKNMTGFKLVDNLVFPDIDIYSTNIIGDTILTQKIYLKILK